MSNEIKTTQYTNEEKSYFEKRLNIIIGQMNGIKKMIADDRYCEDILMQISAVDKSLKGIGTKMLRKHLSEYLNSNLEKDNEEVLDEIISLFSLINK